MANRNSKLRVFTFNANGRVMTRFCFGFTLIELLVVIAIISLLAAILFPVFGKAKERGRAAKCTSNLKQIAAAWLMYADDNSGMACPAYYYSSDRRFIYSWDFTIDVQNRGKEIPGLLTLYTTTGEINSCPSFNYKDSERAYTGYAYNTGYVGGESVYRRSPCLLSKIADPTGTAVFADAGWGNPVKGHNYLRPPSDSLYMGGKAHFRHNGSANVAYADGHVKSTRVKHLYNPGEPDCGALSEDDSAYDLE